ncbi:V-type ATPase [Coniochaeta ligniaria NRRL 30616]|uniref:V-type proton ATPase subunit G n=1 Tax=Coniochaeta ligniaria NRRL 30616 TaxID=1408157 RepID=A0A1J7J7E0_9PEZI|nr:V-type ATPase [Coniochaeta ligniaria NRRL 30616]
MTDCGAVDPRQFGCNCAKWDRHLGTAPAVTTIDLEPAITLTQETSAASFAYFPTCSTYQPCALTLSTQSEQLPVTHHGSAQNSAGIQTLLDAEREASKIVQKAREYRTKRVKESRDEAKKEIEAYRAKKEEEFKKFEAEHTQGNKQAEEEANKEAEARIKEIKDAGKKNQDKVVKDLLKAVFEVHPVAPTQAAA